MNDCSPSSSLTSRARLLRRGIVAAVAVAASAAATFVPSVAHAQLMSPMGGKGQLSIDQLSGFRASSVGGVSYAGPIGFSVQSFGETGIRGQNTNSTTHYTTFWLAPSADYFIINHLSLGGLVEIETVSTSQDVTDNNNGVTVTTNLPGTTNFTFLPRVGWLFDVTDRFGIWPRGGIGYASRQVALNENAKDTFSSLIVDIDVGFLYRVNENWYLRAAPEVTFGIGGSHSSTANNVTVSANASLFQFAGVAGIGVMWDL